MQKNTFKNRVFSARDSIKAHLALNNAKDHIDLAVVLGSGLSYLSLAGFERVCTIPYQDIQGLPKSTAPSHAGQLEIISDGKKSLALCAGRHHLYEGYSAQEVCILTYVLSELGASTMIFTNAAGALNSDYRPGDVMMINDHINFTGQNPIIGQDNEFGLTFPDMSQAYHSNLATKLRESAFSSDITLHEGIYIGVTGPSLETSAERRMFKTWGADVVGMSTVLEVIAANHAGMNVIGLSAITNLALGDAEQKPDTIEEVLEKAAVAGRKIKKMLELTLASESFI